MSQPESPLTIDLGPRETVTPPAHSPLLRNAGHLLPFVFLGCFVGSLVDLRNRSRYGAEGPRYVAYAMGLWALFNYVVLPKIQLGKIVRRPNEGVVSGLWLYPGALALCFLFYPPFAAMAAWAALAGGDAMAGFCGRAFSGPRLPWNAQKSWAGLLGFLAGALPLCYFSLYWCPCELFLKSNQTPEWPFVWTLAVLATISGALLESLKGPGDDNLRVPLGVGALLWMSAHFLSYSTRSLPAVTHVQPEQLLNGLGINALLAAVVIAFKFADVPGTLVGASIGTLVFFFAQTPGYLLFILFVAGGSLLSKVGVKTKRLRQVEEAREGQRGVSNVVANLGVSALCCLAYPLYRGNPVWLMALAGSLAAAFADTASSELGTLASDEPRLITTLKRVPHGTNGAVSGTGFLAGMAASGLTALLAWKGGLIHLAWPDATGFQQVAVAGIIFGAGIAGTTVDSILGATVEDRWPGVGKGAVNFACTLTGALGSGLLFELFWRL